MNAQKIIRIVSKIFISFSILSIGYVSLLSLFDPHATMAMVNLELSNTDAISSIRGIYGGVGLVITGSLVFMLLREVDRGLLFLALFWGAYAISRMWTIASDGPLGSFGTQWLTIEAALCVLSLVVLLLSHRTHANTLR